MTFAPARNADDRLPWEPQPEESRAAAHAWTHFRDLPASRRSVDAAYRQHARSCRGRQPGDKQRASWLWTTWARRHRWQQRAAAWDAHLDRQAREQKEREQLAARNRHAALANANLRVLALPSTASLVLLRDHPEAFTALVERARRSTAALRDLLLLAAACGRVIPALVELERLSLGMTSTEIALTERRDDALGALVPTDPEAVELALALLDRLVQLRIEEGAGR